MCAIAPLCVYPSLSTHSFPSLIFRSFPALFNEIGGKPFSLLWRGSRDRFGACDFHGHCDSHAPTLTLIQDMVGTIFAGFTPVHWKSFPAPGEWTVDPSLKSFIFTLMNQTDLTARNLR
jgi:hypothetical protein